MSKTNRAFLKAVCAVTGNLSAAWFALAFITPNLINLSVVETTIVLTKDITFGMFWLVITTLIERILD